MGRARDLIKGYPDEAILEEVRRVAELVGKPAFTAGDFRKHSGIDSAAVKRRFGNWRNALERAGLGHMVYSGRGARYSDEALLDELRRVAEVVGKRWLRGPDFSEHSRISLITVSQRFGGWSSALKRAGLGHMYAGGGRVIYSEEELLSEVRRVAEVAGKPGITTQDFRRLSKMSVTAPCKRFGSWRGALEHAGLDVPPSSTPRYSVEQMLEEVRRVAQLVGDSVLTLRDFNNNSYMCADTLCKRFGSWRAALERAELGHLFRKSHSRRAYSDEQLLEEVRRVARLVGKHVLTRNEFVAQAKFGSGMVRQRYGTWKNALSRAGLGHMYSVGQGKSALFRVDEERA